MSDVKETSRLVLGMNVTEDRFSFTYSIKTAIIPR